MRVHASVYTRVSLNAVWAGGEQVAPSPQPPDPGLEVTVVAEPPDLSLGACCLICLEGWSDLRWDSDTCSPSSSPPSQTEEQGETSLALVQSVGFSRQPGTF